MSKYNTFRNKVGIAGLSSKDSMRERTRIVQRQRFYGSPTLTDITINDNVSTVPTIISEVDRYLEKSFLFAPDTPIETGWLLNDGKNYYLSLKKSGDVDGFYPVLFAGLCNHNFVITTEKKKEIIGFDDIGKPIYEYFDKKITVPSILYSNVYSTLGNDVIALPSGALKVRIPYDENYVKKIRKNDSYHYNDGAYRVTEVTRDGAVFNQEGYLEITLQREVYSDERR